MAANWLSFGKRYRVPLICVLVSLAVIIGLFHAVRKVNRMARRVNHRNDLRQIMLTLANFNNTYDGLPPAVRKDKTEQPLCSWRFQTLPFLQSWMGSPAMEFGEPWDSQANQYWANLRIRTYCWSSEEGSPEPFHTNVVAVTGPGTPFGDDRQNRLQDMDRATILVVEIAHSGIHWMAPWDLSLDKIPESLVHGVDREGFHVLFADGQVWFLSADVPLEEVQKFFTIEGARKHDREQILGPYDLSRS
jgi:hypothetical protein